MRSSMTPRTTGSGAMRCCAKWRRCRLSVVRPGRTSWLSDPLRPEHGWDEVQLLFGDARVHLTCMTPLSAAVRADLRELLRLVAGAGQARYIDDDGDTAQF
jgi:hypothetical protein